MKPAVTIVGLGLVGGSLARALARKGYRVTGVDASGTTRRAARRSGACVRVTARLRDALAGTELLVLAAPPLANLRLLLSLARETRAPRLIVTDVSSVKRRICAAGARLRGLDFVGGHPMAGRERSGFAASDPEPVPRPALDPDAGPQPSPPPGACARWCATSARFRSA
jgi:prephenate dehydrogenase